MDYRLTELTEEYIKQIAGIEAETFSEPWSESSIAMALNSPLYNFYVLVDDNHQVIAYVGVSTCVPESEIVTVAVRGELRGQGFSKIVLKYAIDKEKDKGVSQFFLEVRESNITAQNLYKSFGFVQNGRREGFYSKPREAAVLMGLSF